MSAFSDRVNPISWGGGSECPPYHKTLSNFLGGILMGLKLNDFSFMGILEGLEPFLVKKIFRGAPQRCLKISDSKILLTDFLQNQQFTL